MCHVATAVAGPPRRAQPLPAVGCRPVRFVAGWAADDLYLFIRPVNGGPALWRMDPTAGGAWELALRLRPGLYQYRYYARQAGTTVYVSPADAEGRAVPGSGFDALLRVAE
jgi:hypothetical protein